VEQDHATCGFSSVDELFDVCFGGGGVKKDKHDLELVLSLIEALLLTKLLNPSYMHISKCDEHNILNFKLMLFHLKHKASTKQLSVTGFFGKK
jgi:hypothetical protein